MDLRWSRNKQFWIFHSGAKKNHREVCCEEEVEIFDELWVEIPESDLETEVSPEFSGLSFLTLRLELCDFRSRLDEGFTIPERELIRLPCGSV